MVKISKDGEGPILKLILSVLKRNRPVFFCRMVWILFVRNVILSDCLFDKL